MSMEVPDLPALGIERNTDIEQNRHSIQIETSQLKSKMEYTFRVLTVVLYQSKRMQIADADDMSRDTVSMRRKTAETADVSCRFNAESWKQHCLRYNVNNVLVCEIIMCNKWMNSINGADHKFEYARSSKLVLWDNSMIKCYMYDIL